MNSAMLIVKTKSGSKVHRTFSGSVITFCGIRYATTVKVRPGHHAQFCASCGMGPLAVDVALAICAAFATLAR